jgi:O-antigen ligase
MQVHYSKLKGRYLPILILCFLLLAIIGLQTRAVYLGVFIFIVAYVGLELAVKRRRYFYGFFSLLFLAGLSLLAFYLLGGLNIESSSFDERFFAWHKTVKTIADHPFFGVGSGNWIFNYTHYSIAGFDTFEIYGLIMQRPHNDLLWVIAELGFLGFAIIFIFWSVIFKRLFFAEKTKERTIILAGILSFIPVMLLSFSKERIEHIFLFFLLLAAATIYSNPNESTWKFKLTKYPIIIISLFSIALIVFVGKGEYYVNKSLQAMKEGKPKLVLKNNLQAESIFYTHTNEGIPIASYSAWAHNQLENKMKMVYYSNIAYNQAPNNYEIAANFGMALNTLKKFDDAEKILLWANYLNPRYDGAIFNLAIVYYNKEEYSKAKLWIDKVYYKSELTDYYSGLIHQKLYK